MFLKTFRDFFETFLRLFETFWNIWNSSDLFVISKHIFVQHKATFLNSFKSRNTIFFHSVMKNTIYFIVWWKIPFISRCCVFNDSSKIGRSQLLYCSKCSFMLNKVTCLLVNDAKWWDIIFSAHFWIVANQELEFRKVDSLTLALKPLASLVGVGLTCPLF